MSTRRSSTRATAPADNGADLRAIQGALQHKTARMSLQYSDAADKQARTRSEMDRLGDWFGDSLENMTPIGWKTSQTRGEK